MWGGLRDYYVREIDFFERIYSDGMENGEFLFHEPWSMAITLTSALDGIIGYLPAVPDFPMEQVLSAFDRIFIGCLRVPLTGKRRRELKSGVPAFRPDETGRIMQTFPSPAFISVKAGKRRIQRKPALPERLYYPCGGGIWQTRCRIRY